MKKQESLDFIENNREALITLSEILLAADTVRPNSYSKYSPEVRALAIELVEKWIKGVFAFAEDVSLPEKERDSLYTRLEAENYGNRNDGA
jgi:hypothetical protein